MTRALIVVDIQNEYFPGGGLPLWKAEETEALIVAALGRARAAGDRIILVRHVSHETAGLFVEGGAGSAIRPAIAAAAGDAPVVIKQFPDAFQDTDLSTHLSGIDELLICGMMTQNCIVFTSLSPAASAYSVKVIADLSTAPVELVHGIALNALRSKTRVVAASELWP